ncbi:MAG: sigma-70 family RNA polymerase sigma factor, partial [Bacteroidetes bacterium]|nr:sigma-70 family RNA polymerase sigma factor [Bacteroidota bacterium]
AAREERYQIDVHPEPSHQDPQDIRLDVQQAVAQLPERAREILELKEIGYKYQEIAHMLGLTESAIKMQVKRAYERLQEILSSTR